MMHFLYLPPANTLAFCTILCLIFLFLAFRAFRGKKIDSHPHCRKCKYNLLGSPLPYTVCPECGSSLSSSKSIKQGTYKRRPLALITYTLLAIASLSPVGYNLLQYDYTTYKPLWLLQFEIEHPSLSFDSQKACTEIERRINNFHTSPQSSSLSNYQLDKFTKHTIDFLFTAPASAKKAKKHYTNLFFESLIVPQEEEIHENVFARYYKADSFSESVKKHYLKHLVNAALSDTFPNDDGRYRTNLLDFLFQNDTYNPTLQSLASSIINQLNNSTQKPTLDDSIASIILAHAHKKNLLTPAQQQFFAHRLINFSVQGRAFIDPKDNKPYWLLHLNRSIGFDPGNYHRIYENGCGTYSYILKHILINGHSCPWPHPYTFTTHPNDNHTLNFLYGSTTSISLLPISSSHPITPNSPFKLQFVYDITYFTTPPDTPIKIQYTTAPATIPFTSTLPDVQLISNPEIAKQLRDNIYFLSDKDRYLSSYELKNRKTPYQQTLQIRPHNMNHYGSQRVTLSDNLNMPFCYSMFVKIGKNEYKHNYTIDSATGNHCGFIIEPTRDIPLSEVGKTATIILRPNLERAQRHMLVDKILADTIIIPNVKITEHHPRY